MSVRLSSIVNIVQSNPEIVKSTFNKENQVEKVAEAGPYDVLCNRSRKAFNHIGNRRFRILVENHVPSYSKMTTKAERSMMVHSLVATIQGAGGKFLTKSKDGNWKLCTKTQSKEKVGHALRAAIICLKNEKATRTIYDILGGVDSRTFSSSKKERSLSMSSNGSSSSAPRFSLLSAMTKKLQSDSEENTPGQQLSEPSLRSSQTQADIDIFENMVFSMDPENEMNDSTDANQMSALSNILDELDDFGMGIGVFANCFDEV